MKKNKDPKKRMTRFPVARIKRIMQSNDDIGKVSTSAPVVLSKAIELFMKELLEASLKNCKNNKIMMDDFIKVVNEDSRFDFLKVVLDKDKD